VRACTTILPLKVPYARVFALLPNQLRFVHLLREPFELVVATVTRGCARSALLTYLFSGCLLSLSRFMARVVAGQLI
jgi:hypothetical protein